MPNMQICGQSKGKGAVRDDFATPAPDKASGTQCATLDGTRS